MDSRVKVPPHKKPLNFLELGVISISLFRKLVTIISSIIPLQNFWNKLLDNRLKSTNPQGDKLQNLNPRSHCTTKTPTGVYELGLLREVQTSSRTTCTFESNLAFISGEMIPNFHPRVPYLRFLKGKISEFLHFDFCLS